ncbi:MAG TPA: ribose-phosphate diphosphokinase [Dyella sp.]|uniref:ribose-phosphate diphosphokinase n=1 Tax=Dyella sp. TaxID=1869338 RepID=UPI002C8D641B|nr:ribose-phosphate diphosphokinase [Dyella sp.]HUB90624.1 ribose-phosphate diphosphokinase [Dyella sp.]
MTMIYAMPGNEMFAELLIQHTGYSRAGLFLHRFPDGETRVSVDVPAKGEQAVLVCTLDRPDPKLWPLTMAAATLRELGARRVVLVAPYLAYMRQDARFHPGEAISAKLLGEWLDNTFDALVTVDPHLHRYHSLGQIYSRQVRMVHAAAELTAWIASHVERPLIVGPDEESRQWVTAVANLLCAPSVMAHKERRGDREVTVHLPELGRWLDHTPVLLDDIIASGQTLLQALRSLRAYTTAKPVCVAVHGVFADGALEALRGENAGDVVTTNSIMSETTQIDISKVVAEALMDVCSMATVTGTQQVSL